MPCNSEGLHLNGLGIGEVEAFKEQMLNLAQMLIGIPMLKFSTYAPILPTAKQSSIPLKLNNKE
jgi:hypothetical protein